MSSNTQESLGTALANKLKEYTDDQSEEMRTVQSLYNPTKENVPHVNIFLAVHPGGKDTDQYIGMKIKKYKYTVEVFVKDVANPAIGFKKASDIVDFLDDEYTYDMLDDGSVYLTRFLNVGIEETVNIADSDDAYITQSFDVEINEKI